MSDKMERWAHFNNMKPSQYNYFTPLGANKIIIYNGLSKNLFVISLKNKKQFKEIIKNPDRYIDTYSDFIKKMILNGFIIEDNYNEYSVIKILSEKDRDMSTHPTDEYATYRKLDNYHKPITTKIASYLTQLTR